MFDPDPNSVEIMRHIDRLSKPMRALVREYGYVIVRDMLDEGYTNAFELAGLLKTWRERRQEQWLQENYVTRKSAQSIADALAYRMAEKAA